jgi:D-alanine-D-alanine ligase
VVFVALHGPYGEDGTVQAILEATGLAYTGSGVAASAIGMDKPLFKRIARGAGLPVLPWLDLTAGQWAADRAGTLAALDAFAADAPGRRVIVKPACLGSSVGMSIAWSPADREPAMELALRYDARVLVEPCLPSPRELEVAVLGNPPGDLRIGGPGEVIPSRDFYDYIDKYVVDAARILARAEVDEATAARCRRIAGVAYALIGAQGFARVDLLQDRRTGDVYLNEINTIPGFTPISLFPRIMAEAGLSFGELCARIVELGAAARAARPVRRLLAGDLPR